MGQLARKESREMIQTSTATLYEALETLCGHLSGTLDYKMLKDAITELGKTRNQVDILQKQLWAYQQLISLLQPMFTALPNEAKSAIVRLLAIADNPPME